jgi:hypothetical protein
MEISANGELCLNCLSQYRGQVQVHPRTLTIGIVAIRGRGIVDLTGKAGLIYLGQALFEELV